MPCFGQLVIGPAGSGKSTYCSTIQKHCQTTGRTVHVVNLDPAAEQFDYQPTLDIRELISVDDVMEDEGLNFGPNGGLVFCMEYLIQNLDWLNESLTPGDDDYFIFDCPGQIELYSHLPVMKRLIDHFDQQYDMRLCAVFCLDSHFLVETTHFISGLLAALSAMVALTVPHINVMTKVDLLSKRQKRDLDRYLVPDMEDLLADGPSILPGSRFNKLTKSLCHIIENYSLVSLLALDVSDEDSIGDLLAQIDLTIQYGEDLEPNERLYDQAETAISNQANEE